MSLTVEREQAYRVFLNQFRLHSQVSWGLSPPDGPHGSHGVGGSVSAPKHETSPTAPAEPGSARSSPTRQHW